MIKKGKERCLWRWKWCDF